MNVHPLSEDEDVLSQLGAPGTSSPGTELQQLHTLAQQVQNAGDQRRGHQLADALDCLLEAGMCFAMMLMRQHETADCYSSIQVSSHFDIKSRPAVTTCDRLNYLVTSFQRVGIVCIVGACNAIERNAKHGCRDHGGRWRNAHLQQQLLQAQHTAWRAQTPS